jgi:uncharacterized protein (TIGR03437 family)
MQLRTSAASAIVIFVLSHHSAVADDYTVIDLTSYLNSNITLNPQTIPTGITSGNQGTNIPFDIGIFGSNAGIWLASSSNTGILDVQLNVPGQASFYALLNNYYGTPGANEYNITILATNGDSVTYHSIGGVDTRDYNSNVFTNTIAASTMPWFDNGMGQRLDVRVFSLPSYFANDTISDFIITQVNSGDPAVFSGLTFSTAVPTIPPTISSGGAISASNFGAFPAAAPGSWIEIYGTALATSTYTWATSDFSGSVAPTSINGVQVTIGGQPCYISYTSPTQINVQIPANAGTGSQALVVTNENGSSAPFSLNINALQPGLLAPPSFNVNGNQYVAALNAGLTSFILPPGAIPGVPSNYAKPGDTIITYGIGFGPVTPSSVASAGQIVGAVNSLSNPFSVSIGGITAPLAYYGLAPNFVGLYQFNITVPQVPDNDFAPLTFTLANEAGSQTLYTAIHH